MARPQSIDKTAPRLWRLLRYFWPWIRPQRRLIVGSLVALIGGVLVRLAEPWPLKFILDRLLPTDSKVGSEPWGGFISGLDTHTLLIGAAVTVVVVSSLRATLDYRQKIGFAKIGNRVLQEVRVEVYAHLQALSAAYHARSRGGDLIVRVTRDVSMLRDVTSTAVLPLIASLFILIGMVAVVLFLQWKLALLAMVTVPLFAISTARLGRGIHRVAKKQRKREGAMAATAAESISAIRVVQSLSLEREFADGFSGQNAKSQKEDFKGARLSAELERTVDVLSALAGALVLGYGGWLTLGGEMTPGDLVVFLAYLKRAFKPVKDFAKYSGRLAKATAAGERVLAVLEEEPDIRDRADAVPAPAFRGDLEFSGISFSYEPSNPVLRDIDLSIRAGERVAITGPSGGGKSTLVGLISRLHDPTHGTVRIDGRDVQDYTVKSVRPQISVVLQDTILFATSIAENIAFGIRHATHDQIVAAAKVANAHQFIEELPEGYDTQVAERGASLSLGQKQRIAIARAVLRDAPILVLDEPTTGLDGENEREVSAALAQLPRRTTLMITHDLQLAAGADRVIFVSDGQIQEDGTPEQLLGEGSRFGELLRMQALWRSRRNA